MTEKKSLSPAVLLLLASGLLLVLCGALIWKAHALQDALRWRPAGASFRGVAELMATEVPDAEGNPFRVGAGDWQVMALFVFSPLDCPACHQELFEMEALSRSLHGLRVVGVMGYVSPEEVRQTARNFGLTFPVVPDPDGRWIEALDAPELPWKIVVAKGRDGILYEDQRSMIPAEREAFASRLTQIVGL